jgi:hypothetical protein
MKAVLLILSLVYANSVRAEEKPATPPPVAENKKQVSYNALVEKLKGKKIAILMPVDYANLSIAISAGEDLKTFIGKLGVQKFDLFDDTLENISLEQFRTVVIKREADLVLVTVVNKNVITIYLFDKKKPYSLYSSQQTPAYGQGDYTLDSARRAIRMALNGAMKAYLLDEYTDTPRKEVPDTMINRSISSLNASKAVFKLMNREMMSSFYLSMGLGGILAMSSRPLDHSLAIFNVLGLEGGYRVSKNYYLAGSFDSFSFNCIGLTLRYYSSDIDKPFRYSLGFGPAMAVNRMAIATDVDLIDGEKATFLTASAASFIPILDIQLKVEGKIYFNVSGGKNFFAIAPGITMVF